MLSQNTKVSGGKTTVILWLIVSILYSFYIWGHIPVSNLCYALRDQYTEKVYRYYVELIGIGLLIVYLLGLAWIICHKDQKLIKFIAWMIFFLGLFFSYDLLVKISIEYVHFIQYCVLTIVLCYIYSNRLYLAIIMGLSAGFLDEFYQASPLGAYNWRDAMLNVTGVIWGLLHYWTMQDRVGIQKKE